MIKWLGGWRDRKLQEHLLPQGAYGPIYTVDYGEILFPEIEFKSDDPHNLDRRDKHIGAFIDYLDTVVDLPQGNIYKKLVAQPLFMFMSLPHSLFSRLIENIPPIYFQSHWDEKRYAYRPRTLIDFFEQLNPAISDWLCAADNSDPDSLYCTVGRRFS